MPAARRATPNAPPTDPPIIAGVDEEVEEVYKGRTTKEPLEAVEVKEKV